MNVKVYIGRRRDEIEGVTSIVEDRYGIRQVITEEKTYEYPADACITISAKGEKDDNEDNKDI